MQTVYLIVLTALGGLLTLFAVAGWSSYKDGKLPETSMLFRWFAAGILTTGLSAYAWLFGAGGDPTKILEQVGESLEVKEIMEGLTSAAGNIKPDGGGEMTVGMPNF